MAKIALQDKELETVIGGLDIEVVDVLCENCQTRIDIKFGERKSVKTGCMTDCTLYKCPGCGKWIDIYGRVQE